MATDSAYAVSRQGKEFTPAQYASPESARYTEDTRPAPYSIAGDMWSPTPRIGLDNTPDAMRLGNVGSRDMRPIPMRPDMEWYGPQARDLNHRHSVEDINGIGWRDTDTGVLRWAPNPRSFPIADTRATQGLSPNTYSFYRPFNSGQSKGQGSRYLNGWHFSMADHRREYDIYGMQPPQSKRNTFRLSPQPWDTDIIDMPPAVDYVPAVIYVDAAMPLRGRSGRLS